MVDIHQKRTAHAYAINCDIKAQAILQTVTHFVSIPLEETIWLDIGCGNGGIATTIVPYVKSMTGIDPEPWSEWSNFQKQHPNLQFLHESIESLSLTSNSIDIIICNQVYEHVLKPQYLIAEIYRILKPGGYCYFAGPNLLFPIEPHVFWPFVHWLPRAFSIKLLHFCGSKGILDAYSTNYWNLKKYLSHFEITNAVPFIIKHPEIYGKNSWMKPFWLWHFLSYIPSSVIHAMTWLSPGFVFILKKST